MTEQTELRRGIAKAIARRARAGGAAAPPSVVARLAYEELAAVLVPLVSQPGFDALVVRALQLTQRDDPAAARPASGGGDERDAFAQVTLWLEGQDRRHATEAAAALFEALAALLTTMIGESLTTQYLRKAWPADFPAGRSRGRPA